MLTTMRVRTGPVRPPRLGLSPLPGTWVIVVVAVISISATGVAALAPDGDEAIHTAVAEVPSTSQAAASEPAASSQQVPVVAGDESHTPPDGDPKFEDESLNHGQVVRQAGDLADNTNRGCVTRQLATSDVGKKNTEDDPDGPRLGDDGTVDPDSVDLECTNDSNPSNETGKPDKDSQNAPKPDKDVKGSDDADAKPGKGNGRDKTSD